MTTTKQTAPEEISAPSHSYHRRLCSNEKGASMATSTYHDLCVEMANRGAYLTDPIGKCRRTISGFALGGKSRIDKELQKSKTYAASLKRVDLRALFNSERAVEGVLEWIENRRDALKLRFPVLVDEQAGLVKEASKERYGLLEDVKECLYREMPNRTLIPWATSRAMPNRKWASHTDKAIAAADSSIGTIGTAPSSAYRRVGQANWRKRVMCLWGHMCHVTGICDPRLLRASHIKRWSLATTSERLDARNGLLLAVNIDAAFEIGRLTFSNEGIMLVSDSLTQQHRKALGIPERACLPFVEQRTKEYLVWHRQRYGFES